MRLDTLAILRCPYCGGGLEVNRAASHRLDGSDVLDALLACDCCQFPVVGGIAVLSLQPEAKAAVARLESGDPQAAFRAMATLPPESPAWALIDAEGRPRGTYRGVVDALGSAYEGGYFIHRFSDPTFVVAEAVTRALAGALLTAGGRALDVCGGSGHLTRVLTATASSCVVLVDLYFLKVWLARHFTAPGCEPLCADAGAPLPFASRSFELAICNDAFHYIWTKALLARELLRVTSGAVAITHAHNAEQWSPSIGMPLSASHYRALFEGADARAFAERGLLEDAIAGHVDLSRRDAAASLAADPALTIVASHADVFVDRPLAQGEPVGDLRVNPLYVSDGIGEVVTLRLQFPSGDYEEEYGAARLYLPETVSVSRSALRSLESGRITPETQDLIRRRVVLDLPPRYL